MSEQTSDVGRIDTEITEWAIQCHTRTGDLHTGRAFASRAEAEKSGQRLADINGAEWWLIARRRALTVITTPWEPCNTPENSDLMSHVDWAKVDRGEAHYPPVSPGADA